MMTQAKIKEEQLQMQNIEVAYKNALAQNDQRQCQELVGIVPPFTSSRYPSEGFCCVFTFLCVCYSPTLFHLMIP
jgi:hypothetical protein